MVRTLLCLDRCQRELLGGGGNGEGFGRWWSWLWLWLWRDKEIDKNSPMNGTVTSLKYLFSLTKQLAWILSYPSCPYPIWMDGHDRSEVKLVR